MTNVKQIGSNAYEDFIDEFASNIIYRQMYSMFEPYRKKFESDDMSAFDEAMISFLMTLQMGLTMLVLYKVNAYFVDRAFKFLGIAWGYIALGKLRNSILNKLETKGNKKGFFGKKGSTIFKTILGADKTAERIETVKVVQKEVENFDKHSFEYQKQYSDSKAQVNDMQKTTFSAKDIKSNQYMQLYIHKTKTGTWKNTPADKRLFEKATNQTISDTGVASWKKLHVEFNSMSDIARDSEGKAFSTAKATLSLINAMGVKKVA